MSLAIVIPTRNRPDDLERTVSRLTELLGSHVRITIVDDASDDASQHRVLDALETASDWISVIRLARRHGCTRARSVGLDALDADYALLLDDDSFPREPQPEMVGEIQGRFDAEPRLGVQAFPVFVPDKVERPEGREKQFDQGRIVSHFTNCACAIRMDAYRAIGGYRSDFDSPYGEEGDLCMRLIRDGWIVRQFRAPVIIHLESGVSRCLEDVFRARTYNTLRFIWWYMPAWFSLPYAAHILSNRVRTCLRYLDSPRAAWLGVRDFGGELTAGMKRTPMPSETLKVFFGVRFTRVFSEDGLSDLKRRSWAGLFADYLLTRSDDGAPIGGIEWNRNGEESDRHEYQPHVSATRIQTRDPMERV